MNDGRIDVHVWMIDGRIDGGCWIGGMMNPQWSWPKKTIGDNHEGDFPLTQCGKGEVGSLDDDDVFGRLVAETQQILQVCGPYTMKVEVANM